MYAFRFGNFKNKNSIRYQAFVCLLGDARTAVYFCNKKKGQHYPSGYVKYALDGLSFKMVDEMPIRRFSVHQTSRQ